MIEYKSTDPFGNAIYHNPESNILYRFSPEEMEEANNYSDLSLLPWDEAHEITKEDIYY